MKKRYTVTLALIVGLAYGAYSAEQEKKNCWDKGGVERCALHATAAGKAGYIAVPVVGSLVGGLLLAPLLVTRRDRQDAELRRLRKEVDAKERDDEIRALQERLGERIEPTLS
jgi:hypothetical protein